MINSAIVKLRSLSKAEKVYRGVSGSSLPDGFKFQDVFGTRGDQQAAAPVPA